MVGLKGIIEEMRLHNMVVPEDRVSFKTDDAHNILKNAMSYFLTLEGKDMKWMSAYDEVGNWLRENNGKGLFLYGGVGLGKSVLARIVIPAILLKYHRKVVTVYDAQGMNDNLDEVLRKRIICIDDIGTEDIKNDYGNKRHALFEVLDSAEKHGKLVIVTTNFTLDELVAKYGDRVIDRIKALTKRVMFTGKSFR